MYCIKKAKKTKAGSAFAFFMAPWIGAFNKYHKPSILMKDKGIVKPL